MRILRKNGYQAVDLSDQLPAIHANYLLDSVKNCETGLQLGEIGILAPAVMADVTDQTLVNRLAMCMERTVGHPAREITSGETGMMHAALTLFHETGDQKWAEHYCAGARSLFNAWSLQADTGT